MKTRYIVVANRGNWALFDLYVKDDVHFVSFATLAQASAACKSYNNAYREWRTS